MKSESQPHTNVSKLVCLHKYKSVKPVAQKVGTLCYAVAFFTTFATCNLKFATWFCDFLQFPFSCCCNLAFKANLQPRREPDFICNLHSITIWETWCCHHFRSATVLTNHFREMSLISLQPLNMVGPFAFLGFSKSLQCVLGKMLSSTNIQTEIWE